MFSDSMKFHKQMGFTLIEIIIALVVISLALGAVITTTGNSVKHGVHIKEKTIALWVAQNTISEISLSNLWSSNGKISDVVTLAGRKWFVQNDIKQTPNKDIRRIDVSVFSDKKLENMVVTLTSYIVRPQEMKNNNDG